MNNAINIAFCAGGTLGHINPAISFINSIKADNIKIIFITTTKDEKYDVIKTNQNIDYIYYLNASGIPKKISSFPKAMYDNLSALKKIKSIYMKEKIDLVIGMGGYISGLGIYIANKLGLKTIIHEQNSVLGFANRINIKKTDRILTSFKNTIGLKFENSKIKVVGNPRYTEAKKISKNKFITSKNLLITSGTLGSQYINEVICEFINSPYLKDYTVTFITGKKYYEEVCNKVLPSSRVKIMPFTNNMLEEMSRAGIIISRAGSSTLFEILAFKTPSIIIPSPNVTNNHQYFNAKNFADQGLVKIVEESDFNYHNLINVLDEISQDYNLYISNLNNYIIDDPIESFVNEIKLLRGEKISE